MKTQTHPFVSHICPQATSVKPFFLWCDRYFDQVIGDFLPILAELGKEDEAEKMHFVLDYISVMSC